MILKEEISLAVQQEPFGTARDGRAVETYILRCGSLEAEVLTYGATLRKLRVPDRNGELTDVVLGFDTLEEYEDHTCFLGATIGRYANRIDHAKCLIDGQTVPLVANEGVKQLHGGPGGFDRRVFSAAQSGENAVTFTYTSPDGEGGFPGTLELQVTYALMPRGLSLRYQAVSDKATYCNITNHSYFNLNGDPSKPITDNILYVYADSYTPVDSTYMTTGEIAAVAGTPMDFTTPKAVGQDITNFEFIQLKNGNGYDHNWVLNTAGDDTQVAAKLVSPETGISLEVLTDEPGIQVYSGNFLDGTVTGKKGKVYNQRAAICLETQHYPDSPNKAAWPSVVLEPGQTYQSHCVFRFGIEK